MNRACSVCDSTRFRVWWRPPRAPGPVVRCEECGFVYVNPIETDKALILDGPVLGGRSPHLLESCDLADIEGSWEQSMMEEHLREMPAKRVNARQALSRINRLSPSRGNLLDVGCFCGVLLDVAAKDGWNCWGVEPLVIPAIHARGAFGLRIITNTLRNAGLEAGSFDVITSFQVFEHLVRPEEEISEIRRLL